MTTWHVTVSLASPKPLPEDMPFDVMADLAQQGAAMSVSRDMTGGSVTLTVDSDSAADACLDSITLVSEAMIANHASVEVTGVSAQTDADFEEELVAPLFPEVVGYAEIAEMAGVSRQRAHQFTRMAGFPPAVITTAQGPLMRKTAVAAWLGRRDARPGRRPVTV